MLLPAKKNIAPSHFLYVFKQRNILSETKQMTPNTTANNISVYSLVMGTITKSALSFCQKRNAQECVPLQTQPGKDSKKTPLE